MTSAKKIFLLVAVLVGTIQLNAQSATDSLLNRALQTDQLLPELIKQALKQSPEARRTRGGMQYAEANAHISRNSIFNALNLQSSYIYGTNYTSLSDKSTTVVSNNLTTAQSGFYNVGVGFQMPLSSILNRKHIARSGESQIEMAGAENQRIELGVKQEVIRLYEDFKLAHRIMLLGNANKRITQVNKGMAEKDFANGQITIDKLTIVLESHNKALFESETYENRFETTFRQLEAFTGVNFFELLKTVK